MVLRLSIVSWDPESTVPSTQSYSGCSLLLSRGEEVEVVVYVVNRISCEGNPPDLTSIKDQTFLLGKVLADPDVGKAGRIDLLLSVVDSNQCLYDNLSPQLTALLELGSLSLAGSLEGGSQALTLLPLTGQPLLCYMPESLRPLLGSVDGTTPF